MSHHADIPSAGAVDPGAPMPAASRRRRRLVVFALLLSTAATLFLAAVPALAGKQPLDYIGGPSGVSDRIGGHFGPLAGSGSGAVATNDATGDIYALDPSNRRLQRFHRDDGGTPDPADDTYDFVSAWGADAVKPGAPGDTGTGYEICTVAADCQAAAASGQNGGLGLFRFVNAGLAVDQDTGNLYVSDPGNNRVSVYAGDGAFLRSFGFDVAASGPGDTGTGYELCVAADGDACKAGISGAGAGQIGSGQFAFEGAFGIAVSAPDDNPATGTVFLADTVNHRVNAYALDGSSPGSIGSAAQFTHQLDPAAVAVDSRGVLYAAAQNSDSDLERYDTLGVNGPVGFLAPIPLGTDEQQRVTVNATAGTFNLTFAGDTTVDLPFNAPQEAVREALAALPSIGGANNVQAFTLANSPPGETAYRVFFRQALGARDVPELTAADGAPPLSGGTGVAVTTTTPGQSGLLANAAADASLAVDPDSDGAGPDSDVLYVERSFGLSIIQQFGPANAPGLAAPPTDDDDRHGATGALSSPHGLAVEPSTARLYASASATDPAEAGTGIFVLGELGPPPTASLDSLDNATATSIDAHATIDPNGPPDTSYWFEYRADGDPDWTPTERVLLGRQTDPQAVDATISPGVIGLAPNTLYHLRLVTKRRFAAPVTSPELTATTDPAPPQATTTGAPVRTTTSARLTGRLLARNSATTYRFQWGTDDSYGNTTPARPAGSGDQTKLVAEQISGLDPATPYHYRLLADNGTGGELAGEDMTLTTRAADGPLEHGSFQRLRVAATAGTFSLAFAGDTTPELPFDAAPAQIESALEALPSIGPGDVDVGDDGGPGDRLGRYPYEIAFTGPFEGTSVPKLELDDAGLLLDAAPGSAEISLLPGPPASDRAWELASISDSSGNPVFFPSGFSSAGDRALYDVAGGTPTSNVGSAFGLNLSERPSAAHPTSGWQPRLITPPRDQAEGPSWGTVAYGADDLSAFVVSNSGLSTPYEVNNFGTLWRLGATAAPQRLSATAPPSSLVNLQPGIPFTASADAARTVAALRGPSLDPAFPSAAALPNLYDVSAGPPELLSLMPDGQPSPCRVGSHGESALTVNRWLSADGSRLYFRSQGDGPCDDPTTPTTVEGAPLQLYARDIPGTQTDLLSGPPLSGPSCPAAFIKSVEGAAFFLTSTRLDPDDSEPSRCDVADQDVYRYTLAGGSLDCLTCLVPAHRTGVLGNSAGAFSIADDGSRLYFRSQLPLLPGGPGVYRLDLTDGDPGLGDLALVPGLRIGDTGIVANLSPDGRFLAFSSDPADADRLNPLGGLSDNGGTSQYYLYDDADGSLTCVSCPPDGSNPEGGVEEFLVKPFEVFSGPPNLRALAADGTFAFATPTALLGADHNTDPGQPFRGSDAYEWRDGRLLLLSDGATDWASRSGVPRIAGITPSARDIFFLAAARYTDDAIDATLRIYDARLGGGIDFPADPPPCSLEDCQGPASPTPTDPDSTPGTGAGNQGKDRSPPATANHKKKCKKHKGKKKSKRCRKKKRGHKK